MIIRAVAPQTKQFIPLLFAVIFCLVGNAVLAADGPPADPPDSASTTDTATTKSETTDVKVFLPGKPDEDGKIVVKYLNLSAALTQGSNLRSNRKVAAIALNLSKLINNPDYFLGLPKNTEVSPPKSKAFWDSEVPTNPFENPQRKATDVLITKENFDKSLFRIYWYNAEVPNKNKTRGALWNVRVRSVEYDTDVAHRGEVYVFFDPIASDPLTASSRPLPLDANLFVAYLARKAPPKNAAKATDAATVAGTQSQTAAQSEQPLPEKLEYIALVSSTGDDSVLPKHLTYQKPQTLTTDLPSLSVGQPSNVTLVARSTVEAGPALRLPPTPPLTPPDRAPISFGAVQQGEAKTVTQLMMKGLSLQGIPLFLPNEGRNDLTLDAIISTENRDPSSKIKLSYSWLKPIRRGYGAPAADSVLQDESDGIFFAPQFSAITTQRFFAVGSDERDRRYQLVTAPLRLHFQGRSLLDGLRGSYRPVHKDKGADTEKDSLPAAKFTFDTSFFEFSKDSFTQEFSTASDGVKTLSPHGFLGPRIRADATWTIPFSFGIAGKPDEKTQFALQLQGSAIHFIQDRNQVVRDYFRRAAGQLPYDLPRFPSYATYYQISLIVPVNLKIGFVSGADQFITVSYQDGFPESNGFYNIFTKDISQFTLGTGIKF